MGIAGLLPMLKSITRRIHLENLAGQCVAIDAYSWLHKGAYSCALDLFHQNPTNAFVEYCMGRVRLLQHYRVIPILVFDGGPLPVKSHREKMRHSMREENRKKALELLARDEIQAAMPHIQKCVDVTTEMAYALITALKAAAVEFVVAPYEADAQMAYLDRTGRVQAVITEDSDLLLFGCKRILFKLDKDGFADEICISRLGAVEELNLSSFTLEKFRRMCILSGCDYLASINGLGLKTAYKYIMKYQSTEKIVQAIRIEGGKQIPKDYEEDFKKAELTFSYQRVYDETTRQVISLTPIEASLEYDSLDFLGPILDSGLAVRIANGEICPSTLKPFVNSILEEKENLDQINLSLHLDPRPLVSSPYFARPTSTILANRIIMKRSFSSLAEDLEPRGSGHAQTDVISQGVRRRVSDPLVDKPRKFSTFLYTSRSAHSKKSASAKPNAISQTGQSSILQYLKKPQT